MNMKNCRWANVLWFLLGLCLIGFAAGYAKTKIFAVLIIVDKYEDPDANGIAASVRNDYSTLSQFFTLLENRNLYTVEKITLKGGLSRLADVTTTLQNITVAKDDIVFVYFSGHGGMDEKGTFLVCADGEYLYRKRAEALISKKPCKFSILITDACSNNVEEVAVTRSFHNTKGAKEGRNDAAYKKLFDEYTGFMSIASSSEGEYSWADNDMGGYFTHYFIKEALIKNPQDNWLDNFELSKRKVVQIFNSLSAQQRSQLLAEGIKGQTPKMLSLPVLKTEMDEPALPANDKPEPIITDHKPVQAKIKIFNKTANAVSILVDFNTDEENWSENNTVTRNVAANHFLDLTQECIVYFESGKEQVAYELTEGRYELEKVNAKEIELFQEDDAQTEEMNVDAGELLAGAWEMDDGESISEISFKSNGVYWIRKEGKVTESGNWRITEDEEGYGRLVLYGEKDDADETEFEISASDDLSVELTILENGRPAKTVYYLNKLEY